MAGPQGHAAFNGKEPTDDGPMVSETTSTGSRDKDKDHHSQDGEDVTGKLVKKLFVDAEEMKRAVRDSLRKPVYDVRNLYTEEGMWQAIARSGVWENVTLGVITFNALWIAIDTDNNDATSLIQADPIFQIAEHFFCVFFSFEWFARFMAFKRKRDGLRDSWFMFDSGLVFLMVMETWVMNIVLLVWGAKVSAGGAASLLRLLRLLRLSRLARMLRSMPELMILIKGMVASTRSVFFTLCLLMIVLYVFAILLRQLSDGTESGDVYFPTIPYAMKTLLTSGTFFDNLSDTTQLIGQDSVLCCVIFFMFMLLGALTVMNMLIGVLCEVVSAVAEAEKEEMTILFVKGKMSAIMETLDKDSDKKISKKEFVKIMENADAVAILQEVGVDPVGLVDFVDYIFEDDQQAFIQGERVITEDGVFGIVESGPHGEVYRVRFADQHGPTVSEVRSNRIFKVIEAGDCVQVNGREGTCEYGPDEYGDYKVNFADEASPRSMICTRALIVKDTEVELSQDDFLDVVLKFRGSNHATVKDMVDIRKFIGKRVKALEDRLMRDFFHVTSKGTPADASKLALGGNQDSEPTRRPSVSLNGGLNLGGSGLVDPGSLGMALERALTAAVADLQSLQDGSGNHTNTNNADKHADVGDRCSQGGRAVQLRTLEDRGAAALDEVRRLRRALPGPAGAAMSAAAAAATVAVVAGRGGNGSFLPEHKELRVVLARVEALLVTTWPEELQKLWRSAELAVRRGPQAPPCDPPLPGSNWMPPALGGAWWPAEDGELRPEVVVEVAGPGVANLLLLMRSRISELRDILRKLPSK